MDEGVAQFGCIGRAHADVPACGRGLWFNRGCWSILADSKSTGGSYCVFEAETPQGVVEELHIHDLTDAAYYVLDGTLDFFVDSEVHRLDKGSFIYIPRGTVLASRVTSETARTLIIHTAPGYERVVRAAGTAVSEPGLPPAGWRQEGLSPEGLKEIQADISDSGPSSFQAASKFSSVCEPVDPG